MKNSFSDNLHQLVMQIELFFFLIIRTTIELILLQWTEQFMFATHERPPYRLKRPKKMLPIALVMQFGEYNFVWHYQKSKQHLKVIMSRNEFNDVRGFVIHFNKNFYQHSVLIME